LLNTFLELLKERKPTIKVVIGGSQAPRSRHAFLKNGLIDACISGEGELAIVELLRGNWDYPGINDQPPVQINDLDALPFPSYDDVDFSLYQKMGFTPTSDRNQISMGGNSAWITTSRGCVRRCTFCDIGQTWPKYRYRSPENVLEEFIEIGSKYPNIEILNFTDSLINGNIPFLMNLSEQLILSQEQNRLNRQINWNGQFICRPEKQMGEEVYQAISLAGCNEIFIGIESGSERVRHEMKKFFTNEDLDFVIRCCIKYKIRMNWLFLIGYPTESSQDFQETLNLISKYKYLASSGLVSSISLGPTMGFIPNTESWKNSNKMGVTFTEDIDSGFQWANSNSDLPERYKRWLMLKNHASNFGFTVNSKWAGMFRHLLQADI
jgi:anaerobic magnesium-protoporphyrin IX monomethyl ester cyclase